MARPIECPLWGMPVAIDDRQLFQSRPAKFFHTIIVHLKMRCQWLFGVQFKIKPRAPIQIICFIIGHPAPRGDVSWKHTNANTLFQQIFLKSAFVIALSCVQVIQTGTPQNRNRFGSCLKAGRYNRKNVISTPQYPSIVVCKNDLLHIYFERRVH